MTDAGSVDTARNRAVARVRSLLDVPLQEASDAGYMIVVPAGEIVAAVERELGDDALRLPRYYPADEGQKWLLGVARHVDPDTGNASSVHARWRTGLPGGRILLEIVEDGVHGVDLVEFVASPDALANTLRALLAACEHAQGGS